MNKHQNNNESPNNDLMKDCESKIEEEDEKYGMDESYSRKDTNGSEK